MKKLILTFLIMLMTPLTAFAISSNELQNNPDRYIRFNETQNETVYADTNSIKCLRYAPPYYTLQAKIYFVAYDLNAIAEITNIYNYDYNQSTLSIMDKIMKSNPLCSEKEFMKLVLSEAYKNSGITCGTTTMTRYNLNGIYQSSENKSSTEKVDFLSNGYRLANLIFEKYYTTEFWITK